MSKSLRTCIGRTRSAGLRLQAALKALDPAPDLDRVFDSLTEAAHAADALSRALAAAQERAAALAAMAFDRAWDAASHPGVAHPKR